MPKAKSKKYIYWLQGDNGGIGGFATRAEAKRSINALNLSLNWRVVRFEAKKCPICHKLDKVAVIDDLGACLACHDQQDDHNYPPDQYNFIRGNS